MVVPNEALIIHIIKTHPNTQGIHSHTLIIYNIYTYKCKPYGVAMRRISIFIREDQKKLLGQVARNKKTSYSALIREAIDAKLLTDFGKISKNEMIDKTFGILKNRFTDEAASEEIVDGLRSQWEQRNGRYKK